jgi:hypothetical protein
MNMEGEKRWNTPFLYVVEQKHINEGHSNALGKTFQIKREMHKEGTPKEFIEKVVIEISDEDSDGEAQRAKMRGKEELSEKEEEEEEDEGFHSSDMMDLEDEEVESTFRIGDHVMLREGKRKGVLKCQVENGWKIQLYSNGKTTISGNFSKIAKPKSTESLCPRCDIPLKVKII